MKTSKSIQSFIEKSKKSDGYWVENAKLDFSISLEKQRINMKMNYGAIAEAIGTSAAYVSKVFRGDTNMTIETMVKLARATGGRLDIRVVDQAIDARAWTSVMLSAVPHKSTVTAATTATVYKFAPAANQERQWAFAA